VGWASRANARNQAKKQLEEETLRPKVKTPSQGEPVVIELSFRKLLIFLRTKLCRTHRPKHQIDPEPTN